MITMEKYKKQILDELHRMFISFPKEEVDDYFEQLEKSGSIEKSYESEKSRNNLSDMLYTNYTYAADLMYPDIL